MRWPSCRTSTRSPSRPRITGRAGPGPSERIATPGSDCSVAPMVSCELAGQILGRQHRGRLVRLELRPRVRADRQHLGEVQVEVDFEVERGGAGGDVDLGAAAAVALGPHRHVIGAGRQAVEAVGAVLGRCAPRAAAPRGRRRRRPSARRAGPGDLAGERAALRGGRNGHRHTPAPPRAATRTDIDFRTRTAGLQECASVTSRAAASATTTPRAGETGRRVGGPAQTERRPPGPCYFRQHEPRACVLSPSAFRSSCC